MSLSSPLRLPCYRRTSESSKGRLGMSQFPESNIRGVPFPVELRLDSGVRIVHIAAAGMYVHHYDSKENNF